ncbi:MAG TPA: MAPEG family protein [Marinagarivorans sp.]
MFNELAVWGLWVIIATLVVQWLVASTVKAKTPNAVPGKMNSDLGPESFVFRAHRTYMNSIENFPLIIGAVVVAYLAQAGTTLVTACVWTYALARIVYTVWYYTVATEKNPSGRSAIFGIGVLANLTLLLGSAYYLIP